MKLKTRRSGGAITESELVTMSDIAFLLIIFFMITTQFMRDNVQLEAAELVQRDQTEAVIAVAVDGDGVIHLDGEALDTAGELEGLVASHIQGRMQTLGVQELPPEERQVRVRIDATLTQATFGPVLEAVSAAGGICSLIHDLPSN